VKRIGPYQVRELVGQGGAGSVYRCRDPEADHDVAVKVLSAGDEGQRRRLGREAQALASLRHPHVVHVLSAGEDQGRPFMVLEWLPGRTLEELLVREGPLAEEVARAMLRKLADAVAHAHAAGVLHRDLKPDNVVLDAAGEPKLTDFGLTCEVGGDQSRLTRSGTLLGTPGYLAPEQAQGRLEEVGPATDIYGLGAVLYACLTGQPPIGGENLPEVIVRTLEGRFPAPSKLRPGLSRELEAICLRCLATNPAERFPSATALEWALAASSEGPEDAQLPIVMWLPLVAGLLLAAVSVWAALGPGEPVATGPGPAPGEVGEPESEPSVTPSPGEQVTPGPALPGLPTDYAAIPAASVVAPDWVVDLYPDAAGGLDATMALLLGESLRGGRVFNPFTGATREFDGPQSELAATYFKLAYQLGDGQIRGLSAFQLANQFDEGLGLARNPAEAIRLYQEAAALEIPRAFQSLGTGYYFGNFGAEDRVSAERWWTEGVAAREDDMSSSAWCKLGLVLLATDGVYPYQRALELGREALREMGQGASSPRARRRLGRLLYSRGPTPEERAEGRELLVSLAELGDYEAAYWLGAREWEQGRREEGLPFLTVAAEMGSNRAIAYLWRLRGEGSVEIPDADFRTWLRGAESQPHAGECEQARDALLAAQSAAGER
jgi:TPR repeat protein